MDCDNTRDLAVPYLEQQLAPAQHDLIRDHLGACVDCSKYVQRLADQQATLDVLRPPADPRLADASFWGPMDEALAAHRATLTSTPAVSVSFWRRRLEVTPLGLMAYAAALLLALSWGWMQRQAADSAQHQIARAEANLEQERRLQGSPQPLQRSGRYQPVAHTPRRGSL